VVRYLQKLDMQIPGLRKQPQFTCFFQIPCQERREAVEGKFNRD